MREILFRGKCVFDNEWVEGFYYQAKLCSYDKELCHYITIPHPETDGRQSDHTIVRPDTVGQFTGLTDKNGNKIFEGDIVHCVSMTDMANMVVIFEDGEFRMVLCEKYKDYIPGCGFYAIRCFDKEVTGNIHDNPELIGGADNGC